jgi:hypothetical protein
MFSIDPNKGLVRYLEGGDHFENLDADKRLK